MLSYKKYILNLEYSIWYNRSYKFLLWSPPISLIEQTRINSASLKNMACNGQLMRFLTVYILWVLLTVGNSIKLDRQNSFKTVSHHRYQKKLSSQEIRNRHKRMQHCVWNIYALKNGYRLDDTEKKSQFMRSLSRHSFAIKNMFLI